MAATTSSKSPFYPAEWNTLLSHFSNITRQAQYEHPCLVPCYNYGSVAPQAYQRYLSVRPTNYPHHSVLVPANPYLMQEIPHWLNVYFKCKSNTVLCHLSYKQKLTASTEIDHKLRWNMFRLSDLECYNAMLTRLYKQELQNIVMRYETYRWVPLYNLTFSQNRTSFSGRPWWWKWKSFVPIRPILDCDLRGRNSFL